MQVQGYISNLKLITKKDVTMDKEITLVEELDAYCKEITSEEELVAHCREITNGADEWKRAVADLALCRTVTFSVIKEAPAISENGIIVRTIGLPTIGLPEICVLLGPRGKESTVMDSDRCDRAIQNVETYLSNVAAGLVPSPTDGSLVDIAGEDEFFFVDPRQFECKTERHMKTLVQTYKHTIAGLRTLDFDRLIAVRALKDIEAKNTLN